MSSSITVTVLSPVTGGPYFGELLAGIARVVGEAGGQVVALQTLDAGQRRDDLGGRRGFSLPTALEHSDAVISITAAAPRAHFERLRAAGKPVVLASGTIDGFEAPSAAPDNAGGVEAAVAHLRGHGHRRIGFVANLVQSDLQARYQAYRTALRAAGVEPDDGWYFEASDNGEEGGRAAGRALVAAGVPVTAVVAATDRNALGLLDELAGHGVAVPGDLAVVGFDGIERGSYSSPTLSTVDQHFDEVGAVAARLALAQLRGEPLATRAESVPATFVARQSCGCPHLPGAPRCDGAAAATSGEATLADQLCTVLLAGRRQPEVAAGLSGEAAAFSRAVAEAIAGGTAVPAGRLSGLAAAVGSCRPSEEQLRVAAGLLTEHLCGIEAGAQELSPAAAVALTRCAAQLSTVLWQGQAGAYLERGSRFEHLASEQHDVGLHLLAGDRGDPSGLGWMSATDARLGCLALWDGEAAGGQLLVAGVYDPAGALPHLVGTTMSLDRFPPAELVARGDAGGGKLTFVIPVRIGDDDRGLLAIVSDVEPTIASSRDRFNQWAALLASGLAAEEMKRLLSEERALLSTIVEALPHGVCWADASGAVRGCNQALVDLVGGAGVDDVIGRRWAELSRDQEVARPIAAWTAEVAASGEPVINAELGVGPIGDRRSVLVSVVPLPPAGGDGGLLSIWADVTGLRSLEQRLAAAARLEAIGQLAAGIAHEINTPMQYIGDNGAFLAKAFAAVSGTVDDLLDLARSNGADADTIERISSGAKLELLRTRIPDAARQVTEGVVAVSQIVRSLRMFAHPGGQEVEPVDLAQLIESTLAVCRNEWKYVAEVEVDVPADLPPVRAVPGMINQVCLNLIVNAAHAIADRREATGADGLGRISIGATAAGDMAELEIADDGGGIPEPVRDKVYDQFFTTKPVGKGTGQGLSISRSIVARHGGTIDFTTSPDGTTFRLLLPLWQPADAGRAMPPPGMTLPGGSNNGQRR